MMRAVLSSVQVLWIARFDYRARWRLERHQHDHFQIFRFLSGRGQFLLEGEERPIQPDLIAFIRPNQAHGLHATTAVKTLDVKFRVRPGELRTRLAQVPSFTRDTDGAIAGLLDRIRTEGEARRFGFAPLCRALMLEILLSLARGPERSTRGAVPLALPDVPVVDDPLVGRMLAYVDQHAAERISVGRMAAALGYTDRHLRQRFRQAMRQPILRYLRRHRVRRAQELIAYSDQPLKQVAALTGFKDIHHFTRTFTAVAGTSPGAFRDRIRDGIWKDIYLDPRFRNRWFTTPEDR